MGTTLGRDFTAGVPWSERDRRGAARSETTHTRRNIMLSALRAGAVVAAVAGALACASAATAATPTDTEALRDAVTAGGITDHLEAFQTIADMNGGTRASGTAGYDASLAYVKDQLDATNYFNTSVQGFDFDFFQETAPAQFERLSPTTRTYALNDDFLTMEYSGSGNVTGRSCRRTTSCFRRARRPARPTLGARRRTLRPPRPPSRRSRSLNAAPATSSSRR